MEIKYDVKTVEIAYRCDVCKTGEMVPTGSGYWGTPVEIEHKCNNCGHEQCFGVRYPRIDYTRISMILED